MLKTSLAAVAALWVSFGMTAARADAVADVYHHVTTAEVDGQIVETDENPFDDPRGGVFDGNPPPTTAAEPLGASSLLWYASFGSPPDAAGADAGGQAQLDLIFAAAARANQVVQLGFETDLWLNGHRYSLNLGTVAQALGVDDLNDRVAAVISAIDDGRDATQLFPARMAAVEAQNPENDGQWETIRVDLNSIFLSAVQWGLYIQSQGGPVLVRPMSEMNEATSGAWSLGAYAANTPENFVTAWVSLVHIMRQAGALNAWFIFSPLGYNGAVPRGDDVTQILQSIVATAPDTLDVLGVNVYPDLNPAAAPGVPFTFEEVVTPFLNLYGKISVGHAALTAGRPLMVPESGIDRNRVTDVELRADWITTEFDRAQKLGFSHVTYFDAGNDPFDFTVNAGDADYFALQAAIAKFQQ